MVNGIRLNKLIHLDYLDIGPSKNRSKYLILVRGDFLSYPWIFFSFPDATQKVQMKKFRNFLKPLISTRCLFLKVVPTFKKKLSVSSHRKFVPNITFMYHTHRSHTEQLRACTRKYWEYFALSNPD